MMGLKKSFYTALLLVPIFGFSQDWNTSYENALAKAKESNKPLIVVFAGTDWCAPCIKLDKEIWQSKDFIDYSSKHYLLYRADFPRKKSNKLPEEIAKKNGQLAEKFNPQGYFPLVVVLDADQKVLGSYGYKKVTPKEYISLLNTSLE